MYGFHGAGSVESEWVPPPPVSGSDRLDVRRMGIAECRVAVFHISPYAWRNAYAETCRRWAEFITQCLIHQVGFVQGDGNLFAQRNFKRDFHCDTALPRLCTLEATENQARLMKVKAQIATFAVKYGFWRV